jgi:ribulose-5-phosphate 4-epimerase/fuculose-1-phosphate aldolase
MTDAEPRHATQREEICRVGRSLFERGYVHATAGNVSVRLPDGAGFLITPTDACLGFLEPARLAHVNLAGEQVAGDRASKTLALHRRIYDAAPEAHCVIHTHSTHLVALTLAGVWSEADILPPITPYYVMKVGHVPLISYHRPGDPAAAQRVAEAIAAAAARGTPLRAVMLDRLGPNVWHASPAEAMATLEELEETARLWLMCARLRQAHGSQPLSPLVSPLGEPQLQELRQHFGARW